MTEASVADKVVASQTELVLLVRELAFEVVAMRAALAALVATHPAPAKMLDAYLEAVDKVADSTISLHPGMQTATGVYLNMLLARTAP